MNRVISISDCMISKDPSDVLVTHGLGSCLGVIVYDKILKVGGMLHFLLPAAGDKVEQADFNPFAYGDTGLSQMLKQFKDLGSKRENLRIVMAGGASMSADPGKDFFSIGKKNITMARKCFWQNNLMVDAECVGGTISRTLYLEIGSGQTWYTNSGKRIDL
jgi:chemotaxis protein CheD